MRDRSNILVGKNAVLSAFKSDTTIERIFIRKGLSDGRVNTIIKKSRQAGINPEFVDSGRLDEMCYGENHQGICAFISEYRYYEVEDIISLAKERNELPFIVFLDGIVDPQNLGAIIRSANLLGAHGVVIEKRNSATLTSSAAKASAGAVAHTYTARVSNLKNTVETLKKQGIWFACGNMSGKSIYDTDFNLPLGLIIGGEEKGVSRLVRESCDFNVSIPMRPISGEIGSFNASVAFGIIGAEVVKQRLYGK